MPVALVRVPRAHSSMRLLLALALAAAARAAPACSFCALDGQGRAVAFDLSALGNASYDAGDYSVTTPCGQVRSPVCGWASDPMLQSCKGVGDLSNISVALAAGGAAGFNLTLRNGFDDPPMPNGRNAHYIFVCDSTVPPDNAPDVAGVTEAPPGFYNVVWRTPAACGAPAGSACGPAPPVPPPAPPPTPCMPGSDTCLPPWTPTWAMRHSTVLYTCNNTGMHSVTEANKYGAWRAQPSRANARGAQCATALAPILHPPPPLGDDQNEQGSSSTTGAM